MYSLSSAVQNMLYEHPEKFMGVCSCFDFKARLVGSRFHSAVVNENADWDYIVARKEGVEEFLEEIGFKPMRLASYPNLWRIKTRWMHIDAILIQEEEFDVEYMINMEVRALKRLKIDHIPGKVLFATLKRVVKR